MSTSLLEIENLRPQPKPGAEPESAFFIRSSRWLPCTLKFEKHWTTVSLYAQYQHVMSNHLHLT